MLRPTKQLLGSAKPIGPVSLGLDLYILILPIAGVAKLQMPLRRKLGVVLMFLTGFTWVAIVCQKAI